MMNCNNIHIKDLSFIKDSHIRSSMHNSQSPIINDHKRNSINKDQRSSIHYDGIKTPTNNDNKRNSLKNDSKSPIIRDHIKNSINEGSLLLSFKKNLDEDDSFLAYKYS